MLHRGRNKRVYRLYFIFDGRMSNVPSPFIGRVKRTKLKVEGTCKMKRKCVTTMPERVERKI